MRHLAFLLVLPLAGADWPQWRGPGSTGISTEPGVTTEWGPEKNILWKSAVPGRGHSQPVVIGDRIFLTAEIEGAEIAGAKPPTHTLGGQVFVHPDSVGSNRHHEFLVLGLDRASGKILWRQTAYSGRVYDDRHKKGSYASQTPVSDGTNVYAWFGSEGLYAYTLDGKPVWKSQPGLLPQIGLGPGTSLAIDGNLLFLQCDINEGEGSSLIAIDKRTGKRAWKAVRKAGSSWATPLVVSDGRRKLLVASGTESVIAYEAATGKEVWQSKGVAGYAVPSPIAGDGLVYVSAGYPEKRAYALRIADGSVVWSYDRGTAYVPSPILYRGRLYLITDKGILTCLDAKTGEVKYPGGPVPKPATFTASIVAVDGKLLLTSDEGETFVVKAGDTHEVLGTNSVGEPVFASPAIANGVLYLRGANHLFAVKAKS